MSVSVVDNLKEHERVRQEYIQNRVNAASDYINRQCETDPKFKKNIELLDNYDLSEFLTEGRSLWNLRDAIEEKYDKQFWNEYQMYVFDYLDEWDIQEYFKSRYNVFFEEYMDWVVRHNNGTYEKTRRRVEDSPGEMAQ